MDRAYQFAGKSPILYFVCKGVNDDVARDLVNDQESHIVGHEIVGSESTHVAFAVGNACPHSQIDDGGDQPVEQIHDQIGAVLPLFRPVDLPESLEDFEHRNSSKCRCEWRLSATKQSPMKRLILTVGFPV